MNYAKIKSNKVVEYPLSWSDITSRFPDTSFVAGDYTPPDGYVFVETEAIPEHNQWLQIVTKDKVKKVGDKWVQKFLVVDKTGDELKAGKKEYSDWLMKQYSDAIQLRLDKFAQDRGYDNILSACTYATSKVARFKAEGQKAVNIRDQVWDAFYKAIESGQFSTYEEIEKQLPLMAW